MKDNRMRSLWVGVFGLFSLLFPISESYCKTTVRVEDAIKLPDSTNVQVLVTKKGASFIGRIEKIVGDEIRFKTDTIDTMIFIPDIKTIREVPLTSIKNGKYWYPDPNASRLYLTPTARPLHRGEGYVSGYYVIVPLVTYGLTDNLSIAGGGTFLLSTPMIGGVYILPKFGVSFGDYVSVAGGVAAGKSWGAQGFSPALGAAFVLLTLGPPEISVTAGTGYAAYRGTNAEDTLFSQTPAFVVGSSIRILRKMAFVTENYLIKNWLNYSPIVTYGLRFFGENFTLDVAFINTVGYGGFSGKFPGLPIAAITYKF